MKNILIFLLIISMIVGAADGLARTGGPQGIRVASLTVDGNVVAAGTVTGGATTSTGNINADQTWGANFFLKCASGTGIFDWSPSSGIFKTSTGTNTLGGNVVISGTKTFTTGTGAVALNGATTIADLAAITAGSGSAAYDLSASTGAFTTSTGTNTLSGNTVISGSKTFTTGTGAIALNGDVTIAATKGIT
jgi:hypothetical protein